MRTTPVGGSDRRLLGGSRRWSLLPGAIPLGTLGNVALDGRVSPNLPGVSDEAGSSFESARPGRIVCRYCDHAEHRLLPPGVELEGKYQYAPTRQVDVQHIRLDVTPDFAAKTVRGTATIRAVVIAAPVEVLRLDAVNLDVAAVRCAEHEVKDFTSSRNELLVSFSRPLPAGTELAIEIDYAAQPVQGLYFRTADMGYPASDTHLWTQGEAHEARHWFPCFDYPNERSSTEIICHVPAEMTVLSNGRLVGEEAEADGMKAVHWLHEKPHVSYLICLVAGHFAKLEKQAGSVPLGFYTQPSLAEHAANSFADTDKIMAFFEEEIGVPFPWPKYDQVTILDFTAGGMENTTLTTLTHTTIFSDATENIRTTRRLDAHELAHQWFGDLVTCKDWSHLWLNEGFATYYTHLYEGHAFGRDAMLYGLYEDAEERILNRGDDPRPVVFNEYTNPMQQFDFRSYPKGGWVLHMLRSQLGEDLYRDCIKAYLEKHALSSVVSDDLRQVIEEKSGRPFDRFFDQWLYAPRHPDLKVEYGWLPKPGLAKVTVTQTHKADNGVRIFAFPTTLRFVVDGEVIDQPIEIRQQREDFYVPLPAQPEIVRFDPEYTLLASITFEKPDPLLKAQVRNADDMIGRLLATKALASRKTKEAAELLKERLENDPFYGVRIAAAEALTKHDTPETLEMLATSWQGQRDARVREAVVRQVARRYHPRAREVVRDVLASERNPAILAVATRALGRASDHEAAELIAEQLTSETFRNELAVAAMAAIEDRRDDSFVPRLMEVLERHPDRFTTQGLAQGLMTLGRIARELEPKSDVRRFLLGFVNDPRVELRAASLRALGELGDPQATAIVESLVDAADPRVAAAAKAAVEALRREKPVTPEEVVALRQDVSKLEGENAKLRDQLEAIRKQVESLAKPAKSGGDTPDAG
jgi:aminopeptidase N